MRSLKRSCLQFCDMIGNAFPIGDKELIRLPNYVTSALKRFCFGKKNTSHKGRNAQWVKKPLGTAFACF